MGTVRVSREYYASTIERMSIDYRYYASATWQLWKYHANAAPVLMNEYCMNTIITRSNNMRAPRRVKGANDEWKFEIKRVTRDNLISIQGCY